MSADRAAVRTSRLTKTYRHVTVLHEVDLDFGAGEFTALMGPSGSGKSTFVRCVAGIERPSAGRVWLGETRLTGLGDEELSAVRRERIGFLTHCGELMPALSIQENVMLPLELANRKIDKAFAARVIAAMGLETMLPQRPAHLSGMQRRRVVAARALVGKPDVVIADEPTAGLDAPAARELLSLLRTTVTELSQTVIMATHDPASAAAADRVVFLESGRVATELRQPDEDEVVKRADALRRRREALG
jgi:putative ABC transport system ATP-binding protein